MRLRSADPEVVARLDAASYAKNQHVAKALEKKEFGLAGDEPGGVRVNRFPCLKNPDVPGKEARS